MKISQYMDTCPIFLSESLLFEFLNLSTGGQGPCFCQPSFSAWPLWRNWRTAAAFCPETSQQEARYQVQENEPNATTVLAVAQQKEYADCCQTLSLPLDTCMPVHENDLFIILFTFSGCNDFIMGVIAYYSLLGCDKLCLMCNDWQLCNTADLQ